MIRAWWNRIWRTKASLGQLGEDVAAKYLRQQGYVILARSDRTSLGEIDLIVVRGRMVVFVEVKTRRGSDKGHPEEAVDAEKQRRIARLAMAYLRRHNLTESCTTRFDVISVEWPSDAIEPKITHFEDAFQAAAEGQPYG